MKLEKFRFEITGLSPLLLHSPQGMKRQESKASLKQKKIPSAEEEAEAGLYRDADGSVFIPTIAFRSALLYAVKGKKVGKRSAAAIIAGSVFVADEQTLLLEPKTKKAFKTYQEIDSRRAVIQRQGIIRSRPRFNTWMAFVVFEIDTDLIDPKVIEENLGEAGLLSGVGDFRVERRGWFGRFAAKLVK